MTYSFTNKHKDIQAFCKNQIFEFRIPQNGHFHGNFDTYFRKTTPPFYATLVYIWK